MTPSTIAQGLRSARFAPSRNARFIANASSKPLSNAAASLQQRRRRQILGSTETSHLQAGSSSRYVEQARSYTSSSSESQTSSSRDTKNGAQPKFNTEPEDVNSAEVEKHNRELDEMKEKNKKSGGGVESATNDTVEKGFWSGQAKGGPDNKQ